MRIVRLACATRWLLLLLLIQQPAICGGRNGRRRVTRESPSHRRRIWLTSQKKMREAGKLPHPPATWRRYFRSFLSLGAYKNATNSNGMQNGYVQTTITGNVGDGTPRLAWTANA